MPASKVFEKWKSGKLHSGSKNGPVVKSRAQATAIYMHEKQNEEATGSADRPKKLKITRKGR